MTVDFLIVGAGIMGLAVARELKQRQPQAKILILEKEAQIGLHASGRNSGVLHSGIYYTSGSWKAKCCAEGAKAMAAYCEAHQLPLQRIGKVIVPTGEHDDAQLNLLYERAQANQARVELINAQQLKEIEPQACSATGKALFSPDTAIIDSKAILQHLSESLQQVGVEIRLNSTLQQVDVQASSVTVNNEKISYGHLFNTAGLYADVLAKQFKIAQQYTILPFKGIYYRLNPEANIQVNHLIYPVPDLNVPFLGVHITKLINGDVVLGPTAVPAWGRENYRGLQGLQLSEALGISKFLIKQYYNNQQGFRQFAHQEALRFFKSKFTEAAKKLLPNLQAKFLLPSNKVGIRAQLLDKQKQELVMDFAVKTVSNSTHVLNAVSPAFTSSFSFAKFVADGGL